LSSLDLEREKTTFASNGRPEPISNCYFDKLSEPIGPDLDLEHRLPLLKRSWRSTAGQYGTCAFAPLGQGRMAYILNPLDEGILKIELYRPQGAFYEYVRHESGVELWRTACGRLVLKTQAMQT
jgi:hypothetical protein